MNDDDNRYLAPDVPPKSKVGGHAEATVFCDRCEAQLTASAPTREEAVAKLRELITERRWKVIDRLDDRAVAFGTTTPTIHVPDLCCDCAAKV